jgi:hypothetical protein
MIAPSTVSTQIRDFEKDKTRTSAALRLNFSTDLQSVAIVSAPNARHQPANSSTTTLDTSLSLNMKLSFSLAALALGVSTVLAQEVIVSNPFNLVVISKNATWNGTYLSSCHEGAILPSLPTSTRNQSNLSLQQC